MKRSIRQIFRRMNCDDVRAAAAEQGWEASTTAKGHLRMDGPDGQTVFTSGTASDWRACKNFRAEMKRAGLNMENDQ